MGFTFREPTEQTILSYTHSNHWIHSYYSYQYLNHFRPFLQPFTLYGSILILRAFQLIQTTQLNKGRCWSNHIEFQLLINQTIGSKMSPDRNPKSICNMKPHLKHMIELWPWRKGTKRYGCSVRIRWKPANGSPTMSWRTAISLQSFICLFLRLSFASTSFHLF